MITKMQRDLFVAHMTEGRLFRKTVFLYEVDVTLSRPHRVLFRHLGQGAILGGP